MKMRILLTLLMLTVHIAAKAQLTLETIYDHSLTSTRINAGDYKYYLMDVANSSCRIYHTDHTLWKTININLPADYFLYDIRFVTQNLFNNDSGIELWYSAYNWVPSGESGYYRYISQVIDEKGKELASVENGVFAYIIKSGEDAYKLVVYAYDNSFWPGSVKTYLFSVPGSTTAVWHAEARLSDPYPNPAGEYIILPLFSGQTGGKLQVFSATGQLVLEKSVSGEPSVQVRTAGWSGGIYTYRIVDGMGFSEVKKFIVR
jgi:hypothetical protein